MKASSAPNDYLSGRNPSTRQLGQCAEKNWRKLRGFDYLAKVIEGVKFSDGIEVIPEIRIAA